MRFWNNEVMQNTESVLGLLMQAVEIGRPKKMPAPQPSPADAGEGAIPGGEAIAPAIGIDDFSKIDLWS
jgi:hypothetical protein